MTTDFDKVLKRKKLNIKDNLDEKALKDLIVRVTKKQQYAEKFEFIKLEKDTDFYSIYDKEDKIVIEATNGVSAAAGFNYYLTEICHSYFGPITENICLSDVPPPVGEKTSRESAFIYRYFMNYCTYSYTMLYAGWNEYERLTDWMLLNGVNLMLNIVGNEIVVRDMLTDMGYTTEEAVKFLTGPAYLPWQIMGNMSEFGGNLPSWWFEKQKLLGNRINEKLSSFGVGVIMPGFYGLVPLDLDKKHPDAKVLPQGDWCHAFERPPIISDKDPLFDSFAESYYRNTKKHFGDIKYFGGDPFHEGGSTGNIALNEYGKKLIFKMQEQNSDAVWFFQGWQSNPALELIKDLPIEDVLIGFLKADRVYKSHDGFYGYPWMYISTPNYGGCRITEGNIKVFLTEPFDIMEKRPEQLMVGNGMAMEGIEMDEIVFDAFGFMNFSKEKPDVLSFVKRSVASKFGKNNYIMENIYSELINKVYVMADDYSYCGKDCIFCARPDIDAEYVSYWGMVPEGYSAKLLEDVVNAYLSQYSLLKSNESYCLELLDITRQLIAEKSLESLRKMRNMFKECDFTSYKNEQKRFLSMIDTTDELLSKSKYTNINNWVKRAEDYAEDENDKDMLIFNAKNLLMLWAGIEGSSLLHDYAHRMWAGMLQHYKKRWVHYFENLDKCFGIGKKPEIDFTQMDFEFANSKYSSVGTDKDLDVLVKELIEI